MSFSFYTSQQEESIHIRKQARLWLRSGLISADQLQLIYDETDSHLHQTNLFFRLLFFAFTLICTGAAAGLLTWFMEGTGKRILASLALSFSAVCFMLAEHLVKRRKLYRYGVEEALLMTGMVCLVISFLIFTDDYQLSHHVVSIVVCVLFAVISGLIYFRAGYLYAAFISIIAAGVIPFQLSLSSVNERLLLLLILCGIFIFSLTGDKPDSEDFRKNRYANIQAGLLIAIYLTVNLQAPGMIALLLGDNQNIHFNPKLFPLHLYWLSYILTFIIPAASIIWGILSRKRCIMNAGLLTACATLATNKSYLGMPRYAWDPAILGAVLIVVSLLLTRWLNRGSGKRRFGFTAEEILKPETSGVNLADIAAALTPGAMDPQQPQTPQEQFLEGGGAGGGGVSRNF